MPSSGGARPGKPGGGSGFPDPGPPLLKCGHQALSVEPIIVYPANKKRYWCDTCHSLIGKK